MPRILLEGRPRVGKTTAAARLAELLREAGVPVAGFVTLELREGRRRVGFALETFDGGRGTLAHVSFRGGPRVGRYGVDVESFEGLALPALAEAGEGSVVVLDELGKMELASAPFREAVSELFEGSSHIVGTVQLARHPFTDALKRRRDVEVIRVSERNRGELPERLAQQFRVGP